MTTPARGRAPKALHSALFCCLCSLASPCICVYAALFKIPKFLWKKWEETDILSYDARMRREYNVRGATASGYRRYTHVIRSRMLKTKNLLHRRGRNRSGNKDEQSEPSGFFKLPWELRSTIYSLAFPHQEIHVVLANQRLWGVDCGAPVKTWEWCCEHSMTDPRDWYPTTGEEVVWHCPCLYRYERRRNGCVIRHVPIYDPISQAGVRVARLLTVSRAMYQDVMSLLYGNKTLRFHSLPSLLLFAHSIPESQLMMVRKLHIDLRQSFPALSPPSHVGDTVIHFPLALRRKYLEACRSFPFAHHDFGNGGIFRYKLMKKSDEARGLRDRLEEQSRITTHPTQWAAVCTLLSTMTGLRHLRISLSRSRMHYTLRSGWGGERQIFAPLAVAMKRLREKQGEGGEGRSCLRVEVDVAWRRPDGGFWEADKYGNGNQELFEIRRMGVVEGDGAEKCRECREREEARTGHEADL